jgi:hypothetical protein
MLGIGILYQLPNNQVVLSHSEDKLQVSARKKNE